VESKLHHYRFLSFFFPFCLFSSFLRGSVRPLIIGRAKGSVKNRGREMHFPGGARKEARLV
jgi:hypothetical protein